MVELFRRCCNAKYIQTSEGGDYAIEIEGDTLYLLFEGSEDLKDWINNFDFPARPYKRMNDIWFCHRGFLRVWKSMRDDIEAYVAEILSNHSEITNITIVGYSQGGALGVLATENMTYLYGEKYTVTGYGFGAPRVLWGIIPKPIKERLKNFVTIRNIPDLVTHVPPKCLGFRNAGTLLRLGRRGMYNLVDAHRTKSYINVLDNYL